MSSFVSVSRLVRSQLVMVLCRKYNTRIQTEVPRITIPLKLKEHFKKKKVKQLEKQARLAKYRRKTIAAPVVISCKRAKYDHHKGQTYSQFDPKVLASHGWHNRKSVGDHFTIKARGQNPALQDINDDVKKFEDFDLNDRLLQRLKQMDIEYPTRIQSRMIRPMLQGRNVIGAAETGSGKTLAYLLPILELIDRLKSSGRKVETPPNSPRALIIVPSRELANQVMQVASQFEESCDVNVRLLSSRGITKYNIMFFGKEDIDVAVSTPGTLHKFLKSGKINKSRCQHLVLDEADTLLDDSFNYDIRQIMGELQIVLPSGPVDCDTPVMSGTQVVLVSATMPRSVNTILEEHIEMDSFQKVTTDSLHHLMPHVSQTFRRIHHEQKADEIIKMMKESVKQHTPTMIFCNHSDTCFWLHKLLKEHGVNNIVLNAQMHGKLRVDRFDDFQNESTDVFVCTDICSRGLDTLRVHQVINFDLPEFMSDYIHRSGRVGRVGAEANGRVISFVTQKWDVPLVWSIETAARKSGELENINANIKRKITSIVMKKYSKPNR